MEKMRKELMDAVKRELGEGYEVQIKEVEKNNGVTLQAATIRETGKNVCPTIYIDSLLEKVDGGEIETYDAALEIISTYKECQNMKPDINFIRAGLTKQNILSRVVYQLVNAEKNEGRLADMPHREFLDLAAIYRVPVREDESGTASFVVSGEMCEAYGISNGELHEAAERNTAEKEFTVKSMGSVLEEFMGITDESANICPMWVLTNASGMNGAAVMLYSDYFSKLAGRLESDLYILPSSVHEVIAIPIDKMDANILRNMVGEVNQSEVSAEEFLSGNVYRYSRAEGKIVIA